LHREMLLVMAALGTHYPKTGRSGPDQDRQYASS
jgi:hypothetical protein